jgi:peptidoglycan/LPS O-acetylase OafA/YrhL
LVAAPLEADPLANRHDRLHALDGLRTLAVLMVFAHHVDQGGLPGGFLGVDVFFVLSGYLITSLLLREHATKGSINLGRFYVRRALRLYPALIGVIVGVLVLNVHFNISLHPKREALTTLLYSNDVYSSIYHGFFPLLHTWSLAVEEQFYLLWPVILIMCFRRSRSIQRVVVGLIVASIAITAVIGLAGIGYADRIQQLPTTHVPELGVGILLAVAVGVGRAESYRRLSTTPIAIAALGAMLAGMFVVPSDWWVFPLAVVVCWPPVAHLVLHRDSVLSRAFSWSPAVWLGERSYGFYLWHYPLVVIAKSRIDSTAGVVVVALGATLIATEISWRYIEQPFLRLKDRRRALA